MSLSSGGAVHVNRIAMVCRGDECRDDNAVMYDLDPDDVPAGTPGNVFALDEGGVYTVVVQDVRDGFCEQIRAPLTCAEPGESSVLTLTTLSPARG